MITPCSLPVPKFSQLSLYWHKLSALSQTTFCRCASASVCLHYVCSSMSETHFLVGTESEHVCPLYMGDSMWEYVCVHVCVLPACDSFTMCRVSVWDWMKSDVKEPVRSGLLSETLPLLLLHPPLPPLPHSVFKNELIRTANKFVIQHFSHVFSHLF